jgi:thymidylate kinase
LIVEFTGLPGSGKSTAASHFARSAADHGIQVQTLGGPPEGARTERPNARGMPSVRLAASVASSPRLILALGRGLGRSSRSRAEKWFAFRHVTVTLDTLKRARRVARPGTMTVLHEGICQRIFLAFVDGSGVADTRLVQRFIADAPRPDVVIALRVDARLALTRLRTRGYGGLSYRFEGLSEDELHGRLEEGQRLLLDAVEFMAVGCSPGVRTFVLDADDLTAALEYLRTECLPLLVSDVRIGPA